MKKIIYNGVLILDNYFVNNMLINPCNDGKKSQSFKFLYDKLLVTTEKAYLFNKVYDKVNNIEYNTLWIPLRYVKDILTISKNQKKLNEF